MKSLSFGQRFFFFLALALALTCLLTPWLALIANWVAARWPHSEIKQVAFSRVFNPTFLAVAITLFLAGHRLLIPNNFWNLLAIRFSRAGRSVLTGFALAMISIAGLLAVMSLSGVYTPFFRLSLAASLSRFGSAMISGVLAGFFEEVLFRGILFFGLYQSGRVLRAYLLSNLTYSMVHFLKPDMTSLLDQADPLAGFRYLLALLQPFSEPLMLLPGIVGLFLIGAALSYALARTGNLYLSVGLHTGWIVALKIISVFGHYTRENLGWVFGSPLPKIVSGIAAWIGILLVGLAVRQLTRAQSPLVTDRTPAAAVLFFRRFARRSSDSRQRWDESDRSSSLNR